MGRPGTIVTLAPVIQYSDALPGGPLEVQVYMGANGEFTLAEDDGETKAYASGAIRETKFQWKQTSKTLSWSVTNAGLSLPNAFRKLFVKAFSVSGVKSSPVETIGS